VADNCAIIVNTIFDGYESRPAGTLMVGAIFFAFQIYGDFSGYSDIAIGCSRLFGVSLMRNFAYPYFSRDIAEFWRRWHISLSTWFRDYVYIPMGGSRERISLKIRNVFTIFLVSGFWHGANWTFLFWGGIHAMFFLPLLLGNKNRNHTGQIAEGRSWPSIIESSQMVTTFLIVCVAWIFFRAPSLKIALDILTRIFSFWGGLIPYRAAGFLTVLPWLVILLVMEWKRRGCQHGLQVLPTKRWIRWASYFVLIGGIALFHGKQATFIYFQF
jgi:D-alanyl-lipoteichoic acid acyltransferase DltB (MBOAT superfamily)